MTTPAQAVAAQLEALIDKVTPGTWGHEDDVNSELVTAGCDADGAFLIFTTICTVGRMTNSLIDFRRIMDAYGRTQAELTQLVNSKNRASEYMNGKRFPTRAQLLKIRTEWGIPFDVLFGITDAASPVHVPEGEVDAAMDASLTFVQPKLAALKKEKGLVGVWCNAFRAGWTAALARSPLAEEGDL